MIPLRDTVPSRSFPFVNWLLIVLNVVVFLVILSLRSDAEGFVAALGLVPKRLLTDPQPWELVTPFTSMFLHGGWAHLLGNMLALYVFGDNVEDRLGSGRYLVFYLLCGLVAAFAHVVINAESTVPTIGASGAISGVLAAYVVFYPTSRVITLVLLLFLPWFVQIPATIYIGFWFVAQLLNGVLTVVKGQQAMGGVAWWAHVGGFLAGLAFAPLFARRPVRRAYADELYRW
ncbi:MAG TPA: rhomboid family intramembrane serine protease [bacterium]|jgi:membrane associated rhomboid family serine protease|nr:rhomboid family intramembrane serine protease [bacterium]